jgi:hypothetical protein
MTEATPRQIESLHTVAYFLADQGSLRIGFIAAVLAAGALLLIVTAVDWNRRRWGALFPALLLASGAGLVLVASSLYDAAGVILSIEINAPRVWIGTSYQALSEAVKAGIGAASGWGVIGVTAGALYALLAAAALIRAVIAVRRGQQPGSTAPPGG